MSSVCFFGHYTFTWPDDGVHPALAAGLALVLLVVPLVGQLCPSRVPFLYAYRPYAGNWFFAWHIVSKNGQPKLRSLRTAESLFFEENDPESSLAAACRKHMPTAWLADREWHAQFVTVGLAAQLMQWPQTGRCCRSSKRWRRGMAGRPPTTTASSSTYPSRARPWNLAGWHLRRRAVLRGAAADVRLREGECSSSFAALPPQPHHEFCVDRPTRRRATATASCARKSRTPSWRGCSPSRWTWRCSGARAAPIAPGETVVLGQIGPGRLQAS